MKIYNAEGVNIVVWRGCLDTSWSQWLDCIICGGIYTCRSSVRQDEESRACGSATSKVFLPLFLPCLCRVSKNIDSRRVTGLLLLYINYSADASLEYREQVVDAYLCPGCSGAVIDVQTQWQCRDCHRDLEPSNIGRIQEVTVRVICILVYEMMRNGTIHYYGVCMCM